jgi:hypothetical protein
MSVVVLLYYEIGISLQAVGFSFGMLVFCQTRNPESKSLAGMVVIAIVAALFVFSESGLNSALVLLFTSMLMLGFRFVRLGSFAHRVGELSYPFILSTCPRAVR